MKNFMAINLTIQIKQTDSSKETDKPKNQFPLKKIEFVGKRNSHE